MDRIPSITDRLIEAIDESGLSQTDLGRRVGVTKAAINGWVKGRAVNLRPAHLFAAADALGVEPRWLATGKGPKHRTKIVDGELRLLDEYRALSDEAKHAVDTLVHQIAEPRDNYR